MNRINAVLKQSFVFAVPLASLVAALFHIFGGLFFLASSTFWTFVPPLTLLGLMALLTVRNRAFGLICGYGLTVLYLLSYFFQGWKWFLDRYAREGFFVYPDLLEAALLISLLVILHISLNRRSNDAAGSLH